jgi:uncharacterized membrane protein YfcA
LHTFTPAEFALCTLIAFIAGLIDAMAGGGGIFTMPTLAALGLPVPYMAGTNKFIGCSGSSTATISFLIRGKVYRVVALLGGACGW